MLQYPYHYPDWNTQAMFIQSKALSLISISPTITYSDSIENVAIDTRQCLFLNERKLIYFTNYNYHNCMVECRMNLTKKLCGCVPYYYIQNDSKILFFIILFAISIYVSLLAYLFYTCFPNNYWGIGEK